MADPKDTTEKTEKKARHRSPAYPTIGLREAVERVGKLYKADGRAGAPSKLAAVHIGFATPHGQALSALAALKKFGLVAESGNRIVPTQRAIEILNLSANDARRVQALKDAAQAPEIYRELIEQHRNTDWPADDVLESELITYRNFNPHSVAGFVKDLKDTLEFAGLSDLSVLASGQEDESAVPTEVATTQQPPQTSLKPGFSTLPARTYAFDISIPRDVKGELRIVGQLGKDDLDRLRKALNGQLAMIEAALED